MVIMSKLPLIMYLKIINNLYYTFFSHDFVDNNYDSFDIQCPRPSGFDENSFTNCYHISKTNGKIPMFFKFIFERIFPLTFVYHSQ